MDMLEKVARELYRWGWQEMAILEDWERAEREHKEDSIQEAAAILAMVEEERRELRDCIVKAEEERDEWRAWSRSVDDERKAAEDRFENLSRVHKAALVGLRGGGGERRAGDDPGCRWGCGPCRDEPGPWHQRGCMRWRADPADDEERRALQERCDTRELERDNFLRRAEAAEARCAKLVEALAVYRGYHDTDKAWHEARGNGDSAAMVREAEKLTGIIANIEAIENAALATVKEDVAFPCCGGVDAHRVSCHRATVKGTR